MSAPSLSRRVLTTLVVVILFHSAGQASAQVLARPAQPQPGVQGLNRGGPMARVDTGLNRLAAEYRAYLAAGPETAFKPSDRFLQYRAGRVAVEAVASGSVETLQRDFEALGLTRVSRYGDRLGGWLPVGQIWRAADQQSLQFLSAAYPPIHNAGLVTSQGDAALRADLARQPGVHDVDGTGITVGVLSDSYDVSTLTSIRAADDQASGDLPAGNPVLGGEYSGCGVLLICLDEGRAMMQIVHDLAPGANLQFRTALDSGVAFANGIADLASAGADVIVDDIIYLNEPMFQDGVVAQAVDDAVAGGAVYFSAAGNSGRRSWEGPFVDSGEDFCIDFIPDGFCDPIFELVGDMNDFDPGPGVDVYQSVTIPLGGTLALVMQWDSPFGNVNTGDGPDNDHIAVLLDHTGGVMLDISANDNVLTGSPYEIVQFQNVDGTYGGPTGTSFNLVITYDFVDSPGPPADLVKTVLFGSGTGINDFPTNSSTLFGHANAAGANAVGAAYWQDTPEFGASPPLLEPYSSAGGTPILFSTTGSPLPVPEFRGKPEFTATDGVSTTFFFSADSDGDGFPDFFGTSAAAPHAAAVGALMLEARPGSSPQEIRAALQVSAIDMGAPGFDSDSGAGLIQADAAVTALIAGTGNPAPAAGFTFSVNDLEVTFTDTSTDDDGTIVAWDWDFGDGNGSADQNPVHTYAEAGTYPVSLTVTDGDGARDTFSDDVTVTAPPSAFVNQLATGGSLTWGGTGGDYAATHADDGRTQALTEESTKGRPADRVSRLRYDWTFEVSPGALVTLYSNAWAPVSADGDQFEFSYSTDGVSYTVMYTENRTSDDGTYRSFALPPATSGAVYVRVEDTDRTVSNTAQDTVFVDHLYIRTDFDTSGSPPAAPTSLSATAGSSSSIDLAWSDGAADELGFYVERSADGATGWARVATTGMDSTMHTDAGLSAETPYWYRVQAFNAAGVSVYSNVAGATTLSGPAAMHVADLDAVATLSGNGNRWNAEVTILVSGSDGSPVAEASVSGDWSTNGSSSCTTAADGSCTVSKGSNTNTAAIAFTVTGVSHASLPYDPAANTDPDGDSDGTTISVTMP